MRVTKIHIKDILGIEGDLIIEPGKAPVKITGSNGVGKTSIIEALLSMVKGGHDATLVRNGATEGEVVIILENGEKYRKRVTPESSTLERYDADNKVLPKAKTHLEALIDSLSVNPIAFLTAPPKEKAQRLLEVLPLKISRADLQASGIVTKELPDALFEQHGLTVLAGVYSHLFDTRQAHNREAKQKRGTEKQLIDALGEEKPDIGKTLSEKRRALVEVESGLKAKEHEIGRLLEQEKARIKEAYVKQRSTEEGARQKTIRDIDAQIAALQSRRAAEEQALRSAVETINATEETAINEARTDANAAYSHYKEQQQAGRGALEAEVAVLEEQEREQIRGEESRRIVEVMRAEAEEREAESKRLTGMLELLENFRNQKLLDLPIRGLSVKEGEIYVDDVHISRLNKAKQVILALKVAKIRAGKVPLVVVDNLECLDSEMFVEFEKAAAKSGLQFIVTKVGDGPLKVTT